MKLSIKFPRNSPKHIVVILVLKLEYFKMMAMMGICGTWYSTATTNKKKDRNYCQFSIERNRNYWSMEKSCSHKFPTNFMFLSDKYFISMVDNNWENHVQRFSSRLRYTHAVCVIQLLPYGNRAFGSNNIGIINELLPVNKIFNFPRQMYI